MGRHHQVIWAAAAHCAGGLAEFERDLIRSPTGERCARAKASGVRMGRKPKVVPHQQAEARQRHATGKKAFGRSPGLQRPQQHDFEIDGMSLDDLTKLMTLAAPSSPSSSGRYSKVLPQNKCCSRGIIAPARHGRRMPTVYGFREFSTASHGWPASADHDIMLQMRPQQRFGYFAASPKHRRGPPTASATANHAAPRVAAMGE